MSFAMTNEVTCRIAGIVHKFDAGACVFEWHYGVRYRYYLRCMHCQKDLLSLPEEKAHFESSSVAALAYGAARHHVETLVNPRS